MIEQQLFYVIAFRGIVPEQGDNSCYLAADSETFFVHDIDSPGIKVFRYYTEAARENGLEGKVIKVHRDFLDVSVIPEEV